MKRRGVLAALAVTAAAAASCFALLAMTGSPGAVVVAVTFFIAALALGAALALALVKGLRQRLNSMSTRITNLTRAADDRHAELEELRAEGKARAASIEARQSLLEDALRQQREELADGQLQAADKHEDMRKRVQILTTRSRRSLGVLAGSADALGIDLTEVISLPDAQLVLNDCLERGQGARAIPLLKTFDLLPRQSLSTLRQLYGTFRASGHWDVALRTVEVIAAKSGRPGDRSASQRSRQELEVFSSPPPVLPAADTPARDAGGPVLHLVGKVLPLTQSGYTLRTQYTARAQMRRGMSVVVVGQSGGGDHDGELRYTYDRVNYVVLDGPDRRSTGLRTWMGSNIDRLAALVQELRPSIIHAHSDFLNVYVANAVGSAYGIPVVYEVRGFWEESWLSRTTGPGGSLAGSSWPSEGERPPAAYGLRKRAEERARALPDHLFTLSNTMKRHIVDSARGVLDADCVSIVPNGVTSADFPRQERDGDLAARLGIPQAAVTIGCVSSLVEYEGLEVLLDAFTLVQERRTGPLRLILVGDGKHAGVLREHAASRGVEGVIFTGAVAHEDVLSYYGLIDIFVVPRRSSSVTELVSPLKPYEAFSTGRAVVLSDVRALREIAEESGAAYLFQPGEPDSLAEALLTLIGDPDRRRALGEKGASWVRAHRTWERNASTYLEIYRQLGYTGVI